MKLLALDTATEACSAALLLEGRMLVRYAEPGRGHAELILPMVDELLAEGGVKLGALDAIAVGRGPGAFTGVRIAVSVAQGLAFGADLLVAPVSDLAALAQRASDLHDAEAVLTCIDARMKEIYWGVFIRGADGLVMPYTRENVGAPATVAPPQVTRWVGAGTGWGAHREALFRAAQDAGAPPLAVEPALLPRAEEVARLGARAVQEGRAVPPAQAQPVYLRDRVARPSR